jgi:hypothetical protein
MFCWYLIGLARASAYMFMLNTNSVVRRYYYETAINSFPDPTQKEKFR